MVVSSTNGGDDGKPSKLEDEEASFDVGCCFFATLFFFFEDALLLPLLGVAGDLPTAKVRDRLDGDTGDRCCLDCASFVVAILEFFFFVFAGEVGLTGRDLAVAEGNARFLLFLGEFGAIGRDDDASDS